MNPNEWVIFAHSFPIRTQIMLPLDTVATITADISCLEIQRCMDNRSGVKALKILLWGTQQLLEALHRNIDSVTTDKRMLRGYHFVQTYLPDARCFNREFIEGYN